MSGEPKTTLPQSSRMAIMRMRYVDRLSYAEISRRTGVNRGTIKGMCAGRGTFVDRGQEVRPMYPPNYATDIERLCAKVNELHEAVCGEDQPMRLKLPVPSNQ
jgi:hypothetical protein